MGDGGKGTKPRPTAAKTDDGVTDLPGWKIDQLDYPTLRLTLIAKIMTRLTIRDLADKGGASYAEWRVVARLATMPDGGTVGQVADLAWADRAEVSRAAMLLEKKGYTGRLKNPQDRRSPILYLTPQGRTYYAAAVRNRKAFHEALLEELSPNEREELDRLLVKIGEKLMRQFTGALETPPSSGAGKRTANHRVVNYASVRRDASSPACVITS